MSDSVPLFDYKKKVTPKAPKDPVISAAVQRLMIKTYFPRYTQRFGVKPQPGGRDWGALKRLVVQHGPDTVERYLTAFLAWPGDLYVQQEGWTFSILALKWDKLTALLAQQTVVSAPFVCHHQPPCLTAAAHSQRANADRRGATTPTPSPAPSPTTSKRSDRFSEPF